MDRPNRRRRGLATMLVFLLVLMGGAVAASYTRSVTGAYVRARRAQDGEQARRLADAGLAHAAWRLGREPSFTGTIAGWVPLRTQREVGAGSYEVTVSAGETEGQLVIGVQGRMAQGEITLSRSLTATAEVQYAPLYGSAARAVGELSVSGLAFVDSYDAQAGPYAEQIQGADALGDPITAGQGGVSAGTSVDLSGSARVRGDVLLPPGASLEQGEGASLSGEVVSLGTAPELAAVSLPAGGTELGSVELGNDDAVTYGPGTYRLGDLELQGSATLTLEGAVTLIIEGDVELKGGAAILLAPAAQVQIIVGGAFEATETARLNPDGLPARLELRLVGGADGGGAELKGQAQFFGTVYAPGAAIEVKGSAQVYGALVGAEVEIESDGDDEDGADPAFHARAIFDQSLAEAGPDGQAVSSVRITTIQEGTTPP